MVILLETNRPLAIHITNLILFFGSNIFTVFRTNLSNSLNYWISKLYWYIFTEINFIKIKPIKEFLLSFFSDVPGNNSSHQKSQFSFKLTTPKNCSRLQDWCLIFSHGCKIPFCCRGNKLNLNIGEFFINFLPLNTFFHNSFFTDPILIFLVGKYVV